MRPLNLHTEGCDCTDSCAKFVEPMTNCVRFMARTLGPLHTAPCEMCSSSGETWHTKDGECLACRRRAKLEAEKATKE